MTIPFAQCGLLRLGGLVAAAASRPLSIRTVAAQTASANPGAAPLPTGAADHALRTGTALGELAPAHIIFINTYNGRLPGPLLRFDDGRQATIHIHNDTAHPEWLRWHKQKIPSSVGGATEDGFIRKALLASLRSHQCPPITTC